MIIGIKDAYKIVSQDPNICTYSFACIENYPTRSVCMKIQSVLLALVWMLKISGWNWPRSSPCRKSQGWEPKCQHSLALGQADCPTQSNIRCQIRSQGFSEHGRWICSSRTFGFECLQRIRWSETGHWKLQRTT